jgi:hypothetical protein
MDDKKNAIPRKEWKDYTPQERRKSTSFLIAIIVGVIVLFVFIGGGFSKPADKTVDTADSTPTVSTMPTTPVALNYTFDVPSLLGKNIDEVRLVLGTPSDKERTEPTVEQIELGADTWDNTFKKDGQELLITFNPITRKVIDFFIATDDPSGATTDKQHLLEIGNLTDNNPNYTVVPVKAIKDPSVMTGIIVRQ